MSIVFIRLLNKNSQLASIQLSLNEMMQELKDEIIKISWLPRRHRRYCRLIVSFLKDPRQDLVTAQPIEFRAPVGI